MKIMQCVIIFSMTISLLNISASQYDQDAKKSAQLVSTDTSLLTRASSYFFKKAAEGVHYVEKSLNPTAHITNESDKPLYEKFHQDIADATTEAAFNSLIQKSGFSDEMIRFKKRAYSAEELLLKAIETNNLRDAQMIYSINIHLLSPLMSTLAKNFLEIKHVNLSETLQKKVKKPEIDINKQLVRAMHAGKSEKVIAIYRDFKKQLTLENAHKAYVYLSENNTSLTHLLEQNKAQEDINNIFASALAKKDLNMILEIYPAQQNVLSMENIKQATAVLGQLQIKLQSMNLIPAAQAASHKVKDN